VTTQGLYITPGPYPLARVLTEPVLGRVEKRPARLDLTAYPHLPRPEVQATVPGDYRVLLMAEAAA
jgi:hypothetical protein